MSVVCKFNNTEHASLDDLHRYLRKFRVKQENYYHEYYPRHDLMTGELIPYKNYEQYFNQEFKDKNSLKKWIKLNPEKGKEWAINWLKKRKEEKGLIYAPSQVELRSLFCPSMPYYDSIGGYYNITRELGFKDRYMDEELKFEALPSDAGIICDTREKMALNLPVNTIRQKVDEGDYALTEQYDKGIYIERKSLTDMIGSFSDRKTAKKSGEDSNLRRLDREIGRATEKGHYLVMLVENNINTALGFDHLPHIQRRTKVSSSYIFKNIRDLLTKYPLSFQIVFADNRVDATQKLLKIFELGNQVRNIDLQNAVEKGLL